jgi:hypothetical protein
MRKDENFKNNKKINKGYWIAALMIVTSIFLGHTFTTKSGKVTIFFRHQLS